jgi:GT2 family glycosyltransferase
MKTNIAVVVPNWNGKDFIGPCLESLLAQTARPHVIVVDNGSVDGSVEFIDKKYPAVELIGLKKNTGFAGGVNRGIDKALEDGFELIALFNNDAVAEPDWLNRLEEGAQKYPKAGIITGKFMRSDKKHFDSTADGVCVYGLGFPRGRNEVDKGQYDKGEFVFGATGGASLYRAKMLRKIGLFDEDFFAYFEDNDISFRAQAAGWKVYYEPRAVAYHEVGGTSSKLGSFARYHSTKNIVLLFDRNMPGVLFWKYKLLNLLLLGRIFFGSIRDRQVGAYIHGLWSAFVLTPKTIIARRRNKKLRSVPSSTIDSLLYHGRPPRPPKLKEMS